jgi:hypothetical protein
MLSVDTELGRRRKNTGPDGMFSTLLVARRKERKVGQAVRTCRFGVEW